jgi:hypothetical protein
VEVEQNTSEDGRRLDVVVEGTEEEAQLALLSLAFLASLSRAREQGVLSLEQVKTIYDRVFELVPLLDKGLVYNAQTGDFNEYEGD